MPKALWVIGGILALAGCNRPGAGDGTTFMASDFYAMYKANPAGSDEKYKGKTVTIEGFVTHTSDTMIYLRTETQQMAVSTIACSLHQQQQGKLKTVAWGGRIKVRGQVAGWVEHIRQVQLEGCEILSTSR